MNVRVELQWLNEPTLIVDHLDDAVVVKAHPGLSEAQVRQACAELGDVGPVVLAEWKRVVQA